jgi:hypothetical protein
MAKKKGIAKKKVIVGKTPSKIIIEKKADVLNSVQIRA